MDRVVALIIEDIKLKAKAWRDAEVIARSANAPNMADRHRDKAIVLEQLAHDYETFEGSAA